MEKEGGRMITLRNSAASSQWKLRSNAKKKRVEIYEADRAKYLYFLNKPPLLLQANAQHIQYATYYNMLAVKSNPFPLPTSRTFWRQWLAAEEHIRISCNQDLISTCV